MDGQGKATEDMSRMPASSQQISVRCLQETIVGRKKASKSNGEYTYSKKFISSHPRTTGATNPSSRKIGEDVISQGPHVKRRY